MPWTVRDAKKYNSGIGRKEARMWVNVANSALKSCMKQGGTEEACAGKAIRMANGVIKRRKEKEMAQTIEALTKSVSGKNLPASAFLVVEDPQKPTTWHLPVKDENGDPDPRLMGAAWAALHGGYRGNKYEGADKAKAIAKLKALYKSIDREPPSGEDEPMEEMGDMEMPMNYVPWGVYSFDDLDAVEQANEIAHEVSELTEQFTGLVRNIVLALEGDKLAALRTVSDEFITRLGELMGGSEPAPQTPDASADAEESKEIDIPIFREAETMQIIKIEEAAPGTPPTQVVPMTMLVQVIQPGWGNHVDNHYYPEDVVKRDAGKFVGAKMFETDHRDEQKSTRTWVSTIASVDYFTETGAPVAKVVVHDEDFAKRVRALKAANLLEKMECSIYAAGKAIDGYKDGDRKGKKITEITDVASVDWVTRAGAGGRALELTESMNGGDMKKETEPVEPEETQVEEKDAVAQTVAINEAGAEETTETPEVVETPEVPEQTQEAETFLAVEKVSELLVASKLPKPAVERLSERTYKNEDEVKAAIAAEVKYLEAVTGAGRPVGLGENSQAAGSNALDQVAEAANRVNEKYFGSRR